jgi:protein-tyrosine phosphatase
MTIEVLSQFHFDGWLREHGIDDTNVEDTTMAFISIISTRECLNYYLDEGETKHYFKDHDNVLNLDFDDTETDVIYNGHHFKTMSMEQAEKAVDFIDKILDEGLTTHIMIHCRAGVSRSRAFGEFIYRRCMERGDTPNYPDRNDYTTMLNVGVLRRLEHAYNKKHRLGMYEEEGVNYPEDIVNPEPRVINRGGEIYAWELNEEDEGE